MSACGSIIRGASIAFFNSSSRSTYRSEAISRTVLPDLKLVPHADVTALLALALAVAILKWQHRQSLRVGLCPACSYNITGNTSGVCPECGRDIIRPAGQGDA
jgi:hypothetical protein